MKSILKKFEATMVAAAFAEAGEFATAQRIMKEDTVRPTTRATKRGQQRQITRKELRAD